MVCMSVFKRVTAQTVNFRGKGIWAWAPQRALMRRTYSTACIVVLVVVSIGRYYSRGSDMAIWNAREQRTLFRNPLHATTRQYRYHTERTCWWPRQIIQVIPSDKRKNDGLLIFSPLRWLVGKNYPDNNLSFSCYYLLVDDTDCVRII